MNASPIVWAFAALAATASGYFLAVTLACVRFRARSSASAAPTRLPPVSILKPVRGLDPRFEANLRAHLEQAYPTFEILVGAADPDDPALALAARVGRDFPKRALHTFATGPEAPGNRKVAILEQLAEHARHELLLVDDADIHPPPGWLATTVAALAQPDTGLATCLYRSRPGLTPASKLDALYLATDFPGQALTAAELGGMSFGLGATMLFRRADLDRIGGFAALRPYLADDYQLGARIAALGKRTVLSPSVVETVAGDATLAETWRRHLRWSRTVRASRPWGHFGLVFTFGTAWSLALAAAAGLAAPWAWLACFCFALRCGSAGAAARTMGAQLGSAWLLLPAADLWSFSVWAASFGARSVEWRGRTLRLDRQGRIAGED